MFYSYCASSISANVSIYESTSYYWGSQDQLHGATNNEPLPSIVILNSLPDHSSPVNTIICIYFMLNYLPLVLHFLLQFHFLYFRDITRCLRGHSLVENCHGRKNIIKEQTSEGSQKRTYGCIFTTQLIDQQIITRSNWLQRVSLRHIVLTTLTPSTLSPRWIQWTCYSLVINLNQQLY